MSWQHSWWAADQTSWPGAAGGTPPAGLFFTNVWQSIKAKSNGQHQLFHPSPPASSVQKPFLQLRGDRPWPRHSSHFPHVGRPTVKHSSFVKFHLQKVSAQPFSALLSKFLLFEEWFYRKALYFLEDWNAHWLLNWRSQNIWQVKFGNQWWNCEVDPPWHKY